MPASENSEHVCSTCEGSGRLKQDGLYCSCSYGCFLEGRDELRAQVKAGELDTGGDSDGNNSTESIRGGVVNTETTDGGAHPGGKADQSFPFLEGHGTQEAGEWDAGEWDAGSQTLSDSEHESCRHGHRTDEEGCHFDSAGQCSDPETWDEYRGYNSDA